MRITIIGITGFSGDALAEELRQRGHEVIGGARSVVVPPSDGGSISRIDIHEPETVADVAAGSDAIILAVQPLSEAGTLQEALPGLLRVAEATGSRLGIVGGAGSLRLPESGERLLDRPDFPEAWKPGASAHADALTTLENSDTDVDWFVISPSQMFGRSVPGEKTGAYRVGADDLLTDSEGRSHIGIDDFVAAIADELENPTHVRKRFTVGY